jgi:hypothetical protein
MKKWLIRIRRAAMMGLAWAAAWVPVGSLAGWLMVGELEPEWIGGPLYAGFLCGAMFSSVAGIADGRRGLDEMSLPRSAARGAVSGLLVGGLWLVVVLLSDPPQWLLEGAVVGSLTILSAVSGVGSALLARMGKNDASAHVV